MLITVCLRSYVSSVFISGVGMLLVPEIILSASWFCIPALYDTAKLIHFGLYVDAGNMRFCDRDLTVFKGHSACSSLEVYRILL